MIQPIPTNLVIGFLGAGKTTTILSLLQRKPAQEKWAVLVNEFGEVGIDGALMQGQGAVVREVPGGCMCCVAGVPMQIGLNMLIAKAKPDRLLIEPTGLGHPSQILNMLRSDAYKAVLDLRATLCVVDPRKLSEERYTSNVNFKDQANLADIVVGNKADGLSAEEAARFEAWVNHFQPAKRGSGLFQFGAVPLEWLDEHVNASRTAEDAKAHAATLSPFTNSALSLPVLQDNRAAPKDRGGKSGVGKDGIQQIWQRFENSGQGFRSCGWVFSGDSTFSYESLLSWCSGAPVARLKAVMKTDHGWFGFNGVDGGLTVSPQAEGPDSRIELIHPGAVDWKKIEGELLSLRLGASS